ncbi:MAG: DUF2235 domain-containing protein [Pseudomonadota bacterium]
MKRIVILCDGTWNSPTMTTPTNVVRLRDALIHDENTQVVRYLEGVGVNKYANRLKSLIHKLGGGAFGWGLGRNVRLAYQQLCLHYQPGDQIYIFGFSRGAYTARSLAGMIRKCGIVPENRVKSAFTLAKAWRLYKRRGADLDEGPLWVQRKALSPRLATSYEDWLARGQEGSIVDIHFIGIWDTVGAKGLPPTLLGPIARLWNRRYQFYDMRLSSMVKHAYHALALDEQRLFYEPTPWENLDQLNGDQTGPDKPYDQLWFVGNHGIVGGSNTVRELVAFPLEWIVDKARDLGLIVDPDALIPDMPGNPSAWSTDVARQTGPLNAWRVGPTRSDSYHWSVGARMRSLGAHYSPGGAMHVRTAVMQLPEPAAPMPEARQA